MATQEDPRLPRIAITYCTQCRWMLRAAYYAQELLSTFSTTLGEVALLPATGGTFTVTISYTPDVATQDVAEDASEQQGNKAQDGPAEVKNVLLWDRKSEGGFPETKVLKQRVRDCVEPNRNLGHSDVGGKKATSSATTSTAVTEMKDTDTNGKAGGGEACGPDGC